MNETPPEADLGPAIFGGILARCALIIFLLLIFVLGSFEAGIGLHDPDTCWLLALGRYMFETHSLPATDPFSYTFALVQPATPFVMYQWLTEVLFFLFYKIGGLTVLLYFAALTLAAAFIFVPFLAFERLRLPRLLSMLIVGLGLTTAAFHLLVRPEVLSYLMLSLWLWLMQRLRRGITGAGMVAGFAALMLVWSNLHTAFSLGLLLLFLYICYETFQWLLHKKRGKYPCTTAIAALAASLACTLINPHGIGLWKYLPSLYFSPINVFIVELRPLKLSDARDGFYYPFFMVVLLACFYMCRQVQEKRASVYSMKVVTICAVAGILCRRMIPFNGLILMFEAAWMHYTLSWENPEDTGLSRIVKSANEKLHEIFPPIPIWIMLSAVILLAGNLLVTTRIAPPILPQSSKVFKSPKAAIAYIDEHPPQGNMFNDAQYGDVLIWRSPQKPRVFIDTRFDMYGAAFCTEYQRARYAESGWERVLDKYKIDWVFVPEESQLARKLSADANWHRLFVDDPAIVADHRAIILARSAQNVIIPTDRDRK